MFDSICILEDSKVINFLPLVYLRPVYDLRCGVNTLREKIEREFTDKNFILHCRKYLEEKVKTENPNYLVNDFENVSNCLFINGRVLFNDETFNAVTQNDGNELVFYDEDNFIAAILKKENYVDLLTNLDSPISPNLFKSVKKVQCKAQLVEYSWNLISENGDEIINDFGKLLRERKNKILGRINKGANLLFEENIFIGENSVLKPGVVIDAEKGPVYIGNNVTVLPNAVIEGPCFIGDNSTVKIGAKIYENTSIGEFCKVGGEIEGSIVHSHANKQHDGFLGHSYISPWCNLGADTNTSDLKNNYSNVKVELNDELVNTGSMFVGLIMGDHSKSSINTMFNTGTLCGISSNIFDVGFPPKNIPSFSWGGSGSFSEYKLEKAIEVAKAVSARRNINFTETDAELFTEVFNMTAEERKDF